jgi:tellurite resistance protein TerC
VDRNLGHHFFLFSGVIYWIYANNYISNPDDLKPIGAAIKFITGYLIELSLSVDNIFVIAIIFSALKSQNTNTEYFWGILGAIFLGINDLFWRADQ